MGALLARKLRDRYPGAAVSSFPIVGKGEHYVKEGIPVDSVPEDSPSGGVIKYRLADLWRDLRSGLLRSIARQIGAWKKLRGTIRTPLCVGDVYLLLQALWGQGQLPVLVATAKTVYLSGHWRLERFIIKHRSRIAWTRDRETAEELLRSGAAARFDGNPIMDLTCDNTIKTVSWGGEKGFSVLLPGSRRRAYEDVRLLLDAAELLNGMATCSYLMVIAPTLNMDELLKSCRGWTSFEEGGWRGIRKGEAEILFFFGALPAVTEDAHLLIGLGGTANQVCAGMGVPVVSIEEKGKFVQKKLLGESELLVPPTAKDLAEGAARILTDEALRSRMAREGRDRLGGPGALDMVVEHTAEKWAGTSAAASTEPSGRAGAFKTNIRELILMNKIQQSTPSPSGSPTPGARDGGIFRSAGENWPSSRAHAPLKAQNWVWKWPKRFGTSAAPST